ncbi:aerobic carbon-monoxide dehydrogenase large subunit [Sphaerobacter sp.]|uniref:aerobic carbon-monoxide dehydrogenase large subunit n=1 Tax=Sphaerobacter sp. TaxID=2099654 RepID=UPI001D82B33E|nr:aerobic carbon-monoxide dehydrogenase large subunit [Sphaerobacter sp.]MBX5444194.1 carbon-monoxide dehydrogenase large subunit [Sphaerobacter sp.]
MTATERAAIGGLGHPVKRKEDPRFIRGKGTYVDDIKLPGMLYLDILRSPYAHARITKLDSAKAVAMPGVVAVITGKDLEAAGLAWMPTLMSDRQMVLPTDRVVYYAQEVAAVIAEDRYTAADAVLAIDVEYEALEPVLDPFRALEPDAPLVRPDREEKTNHIWNWQAGDKEATDRIFEEAEVVVSQKMYIPRIHVSSIETCGCVASFDKVSGKLTVWMTSQAPHAHRTVFSLVSGIPETKIRVISPDIGGGFGGKVPVYPGYVLAIVASLQTGRPVKWIEDRSENLQADSFARDYHIHAEIAATRDGKMRALRVHTVADHGAFDAAANPSKFPAGLFSIGTGSYTLEAAHFNVDGVYTNKAPGGIAYRCSFRVTEAVHMIERMVDVLADELNMDPAEIRFKNFIQPEQFPYKSPTGWEYDSGNYPAALQKALDAIGYQELRREQAEKRARGELMGIGISTFTEIVGAGPSHTFDILGIKMFDSAEIRVHPTGSALVRIGVQTQGQGHETTFAQIVAEELGLPVENIVVEHGDTDTAPYGLGTYASRSTPTAGAATAVAARKIREKARLIAAHLLEVDPDDLEWRDYAFRVKGSPERAKTMSEIAFAAYTNFPQGLEGGLEAVTYYDPPNLTFPFGAYVCVVDIDRGTGQPTVREFLALDDCGTIINPMIVEGQIHGGLTMGLAPALFEEIVYDENGTMLTGTFMDYLVPTAMETPNWRTEKTVTPSPHHPIGAKGVGESPTVGAPPAIVNAVVDALSHLGVRHIDIPITPWKVYQILQEKGVAE